MKSTEIVRPAGNFLAGQAFMVDRVACFLKFIFHYDFFLHCHFLFLETSSSSSEGQRRRSDIVSRLSCPKANLEFHSLRLLKDDGNTKLWTNSIDECNYLLNFEKFDMRKKQNKILSLLQILVHWHSIVL